MNMESSMVVALPRKEDFAAQVGTDFALDLGEGTRLSLRLAEIEDGPVSAGYEPFALQFHAPGAMPPVQHVYHLEHEALGGMDVFLVPIGREGDTLILEAVFNRIVDAEKE